MTTQPPPGADDDGYEQAMGRDPIEPTEPQAPTEINGIAGLQGREPIAAALAVGKKGPSGAPIERDRFHVLRSHAQTAKFGGRSGLVREPHPSFPKFNAAPPEHRQSVSAVLAHATAAECWEHRLQAQVLPGIAHPRKAPACKGDGETAERWDPQREEFVTMACPHDRCPHRQTDGRKPAACKPWMKFLARFSSPKMPQLLFKYTSGSWNTVKAFLGFFESFERNCRNLGVDPATVPLFGLPVVLQLQERTDASQKRKFPVVTIAVSEDKDIIAWVMYQQQRIHELAALPPVAGLIETSEDRDHDLISGAQGLGG